MQVLLAYQADLRRPSTSIYLLDVSGSMEGERIAQLRKALEVLTGAESNSVTARFIRFQNRENVVLIKFSSETGNPEEITFDDPAKQAETYAHLRDYAARLEARGGTAIYSSLDRAYQIAIAERRRDPDRFVSVVLLTDGQNRSGLEFGEFRRRAAQRAAGGRGGAHVPNRVRRGQLARAHGGGAISPAAARSKGATRISPPCSRRFGVISDRSAFQHARAALPLQHA